MYLLLLLIDFPDQYKTIHCKSINKDSIEIRYYVELYQNPTDSLFQCIFAWFIYSEVWMTKCTNILLYKCKSIIRWRILDFNSFYEMMCLLYIKWCKTTNKTTYLSVKRKKLDYFLARENLSFSHNTTNKHLYNEQK